MVLWRLRRSNAYMQTFLSLEFVVIGVFIKIKASLFSRNTTMTTSTEVSAVEATQPTVSDAEAGQSITGRSVFLVETVAAGVSVRTLFMTEDQKLMEMPAVFPELGYALSQIDELRHAVMQHFAQAAQVGAQVIAAQTAVASASAAVAQVEAASQSVAAA